MIDDFEPAYLETMRAGRLAEKVEQALQELADCRACPRLCGVDRLAGERGVCRTGRRARIASAFPHLGEEECLRGSRGSGTIFMSGCCLRCVFCQNWDISQLDSGAEMDAAQVAALMLELQRRGCHNINLVSPEHVVPQMVEAIAIAAARGLRIPLVYNTSGYDALSSIALLDGLVDIYMPDFKFWERATSRRLAGAGDYPERTRDAIRAMHEQVGVMRLDSDGLARRGLLVRHLVMPGQLDEARAIFEWLATEVSPDTLVNVMGQYRPAHKVGARRTTDGVAFGEIDRTPEWSEIEAARASARRAGLWRFA